MTKEQKQVIEFMELFQQAVLRKPAIPTLEVRRLRAQLILEETFETIQALGFKVELKSLHAADNVTSNSLALYEDAKNPPDLVKLADGLADLHYVAYCGTGAAFGIDMEPVFEEVHRSNMSKMWTEEDLQKQIGLLCDACGKVESYGAGLYRIFVDGKVIKSPSYSPADVKSILAAQKNLTDPQKII